MNVWLLVLTAVGATLAPDVIPSTACLNQSVFYTSGTKDTAGLVTCMNDVPIEKFCIPTEANVEANLMLDLSNCYVLETDWFPTGLFQNNNRILKLHINATSTYNRYIRKLTMDTFENLQGLLELTLEGFERIRQLDPDVFRTLRNLRTLRLIRFGGQVFTYRQLGDALSGFSNSSLGEITMDGIHSGGNPEKNLTLNNLFSFSGVNITSLTLINNDFNTITGSLSNVLPSLKYFECSVYFLSYAATNFGLDAIFFLQHLEEINFSVVRNSKTNPIFRRSADDVKDVLDPAIWAYYDSFRPDPSCFYRKVCSFGPTLRRFVVRNTNFFYIAPNSDVCFDESRKIEYIDFLQSPFQMISGTMRGLNNLRFFNLQETSMNSLSHSLFHEMPSLEILLLGRNNIGESVAADVNGSLFKSQNLSLRTLDLSGCGIRWIPRSMFSELSSLQFLNLSNNMIETFQVELHSSANLTLLNLSYNSIRFLSSEMISELKSITQNSDYNRGKLTVDLSGNPLSCLCNATEFVLWLKDRKTVSLENFGESTCLHPNRSLVSVLRLNVTELVSSCHKIRQLNNTNCPCNGLNYPRLRQMSLSLTDVYCTYEGNRFSYADLVANTNKTLQEYWWCQSTAVENPFYKSPKFIVPVTIGFLLLLLLAIGLVVVYKKRYTPSDVARMMQCMDLRPYIMHFIQYLSNHPAQASDSYEFDVFVYFQDDDGPWVRRILLEKLDHLSVITPDNFLLGASIADAILDGCRKSRAVVLVLSESFMRDDWCREVTLRSYTTHPGSVIPVVIKGTDLSDFDDDPLFANLIATHNPVDLSSADSFIWKGFTSRIDHTNQGSPHQLRQSRRRS